MRVPYLVVLFLSILIVSFAKADTIFATNLPNDSNSTWSLVVLTTTSNSVVYGSDYDNVSIKKTSISLSPIILKPVNSSLTYDYIAIYQQEVDMGIVKYNQINTLQFDYCSGINLSCIGNWFSQSFAEIWRYLV